MLVAGHTSALRRRSEIRAMPETEKPPAKPVDIYYAQKSPEIALGAFRQTLEVIT